ncbi:E3 ubiquitin-protein ligase RING1-like [Hibiscus syriacus]|uniref:E3 ubiquitin-protein ligase RING1-like n=1 Tax=Hibiscus syriacus TaxID=106335 RepID=A0A6A2Y0I1_HIBSY|nr:E3 ubiquitin-protein ligase RING1-like [Hibiscus syriacus]
MKCVAGMVSNIRRTLGKVVSWELLVPSPWDELHLSLPGHTNLKKILDNGRNLGRADSVHINGKVAKDDGKVEPLFIMGAGKTYRYRVCNAGLKTSLNFRFQGHNMKLVEMEGSHIVQNDYESLDVHVGLFYTVLVTADKEPRPPVGWAWSLNQFRMFQWNLTASAAMPNPQGSYKYGSINITRTITLANTDKKVDGKLRYAINGVSFMEPATPLKLAEYYGVVVFKYNNIPDEPPAEISKVDLEPIVLNMTLKSFVELYSRIKKRPFNLGTIEIGKWSPEKRMNYNLLDAVSRHTIQLYISLLSPNRSVRDDYNLPDDVITCGGVEGMPRPPPFSS